MDSKPWQGPLPFPRSYWVVPGQLLAGCYPGDPHPQEAQRKLTGLLDVGIRHVINLMEPQEKNHEGRPFVPYQESLTHLAQERGIPVTCVRFPIRDGNVPSREGMRAILDDLDQALAEGRPVYVHCWGGRGRTGTVVGCYLARHGWANGPEALAKIRELRCHEPTSALPSPETAVQREMVCSWKVGE
jgi:hypothetical protein